MTQKEFIAKYEGWFSYTHREELKKQMENDLEAVFQKLNESHIIEESKQFNCSCGIPPAIRLCEGVETCLNCGERLSK